MRSRRSVSVRANAKVNLFLKVKGLRADGYHDIETVYHSITLSDTITVSRTASRSVSRPAFGAPARVSVECSDEAVPLDGTNLAVRAAEAVVALGSSIRRRHVARRSPGAESGFAPGAPGLRIEIDKRIPVGAGLGGGSADAAGALVATNRLGGLGLGKPDLERLAAGLGADVKFVLRGGCAAGRRRGDEIESIKPLPPYPLVIAVPPVSISTAWAYRALKIRLTSGKTRLNIVTDALEKGDVFSLRDVLENDFEKLIFDRYPEIGHVKDDLLGMGAHVALLSGSGSAVFGIFKERNLARACGEILSQRDLKVFVAAFAARGVTTPQ